MTDLRKAAEQALEALECAYRGKDRAGQVIDAIVALEKALAQPDEVLAEREACAKVCDDVMQFYKTNTTLNTDQNLIGYMAAELCGVRIRGKQ